MTRQTVPIFVINLDRRPDRLAFMQSQLDGLDLEWQRVSALDARSATDERIAIEVALRNHKIGMGRASQCSAITHLDIYRSLKNSDHAAALILEDDVEIAADIAQFVTNLDWLPPEIGIVQFEKFGRRASKRLAGPAFDRCAFSGRELRRLYTRTAGAACYLITKQAARLVLDHKPKLDMPIDHFLFSPNVSPLFDRLGVAIVTPAVAVQRMEAFASDISAERKKHRKSMRSRIKRLWFEVNRVPAQAWAMARGARFVAFSVPDDLGRGSTHDQS